MAQTLEPPPEAAAAPPAPETTVTAPPADLPPPPPPLPPAPVLGDGFPAEVGVQVQSLAAPDAFSNAGRETGLPADLWRGASARTARTVLAALAAKPVSPAAAQLARRVLATGAQGPVGAGADPALAGLRASALLAQGDPRAASTILSRTAGADRDPDLARAAAETALLTGDDARACTLEQGLGVGREDIYWMRLRTFCQALAGQTAQAQFTLDLAQAQAKDAVFARLMNAKLNGAAPGEPSLRNGLDYALSRSLGLDLAAAKPSEAVAAATGGGDPGPLTWDLSAIDLDTGGLSSAAATGQPLPAGGVAALISAAADADPKTTGPKLKAAALLLAALAPEVSAEDRARLASFPVAEGKAPVGRSMAMADAGVRKQMGETALLALWTAADAGAAGVTLGDRVRIVSALHAAGLDADARAFAAEGLAALK